MNEPEATWIRQVSPILGDEELAAVCKVVASNWITEGAEAAAFVEELNTLTGSPHGVLAPNGTLALALGLMALGIGPGDEVLVPDTTFAASAMSVMLLGACPVFVDVEPRTYQIDVAKAQARITSRTRAIMPVHLFGTAADMDAVMEIARRHQLKVIEDAAQGVGVTYRGRHVGAIGDVGCFSFFADKTITTGEGGYVACRDAAVHEQMLLLRNQGRLNSGAYIHPAIGFNLRMTDIQAALGRIQLRRLPTLIEKKQQLYHAYASALAGVKGVRLLSAAPYANHVPFRCVAMVDDPKALMAFLDANQVQPRAFFYPLHLQPAFARLAGTGEDANGDYPNAIEGYARGVCLPSHGAMTMSDVERICELLKRYLSKAAR